VSVRTQGSVKYLQESWLRLISVRSSFCTVALRVSSAIGCGMLFRRQRLLLTLLDALGEPAGHTDFQKLLFLYTQEGEEEPSYEFVPYHFGGFSFSSYADKRKLIEKGLLADDDQHWQLTDAGLTEARAKAIDPMRAVSFCRRYSHLRGNELILEQYRRFPYYATRSELLKTLPLESDERERIDAARPQFPEARLLTLGYEGRSLENYLNELLRAGVSVLCDVRRNPLSRKYGFSKKTLNTACQGVGIRYEHLPGLGITSDKRKKLVTQADYDVLFDEYERTVLPQQAEALGTILGWIGDGDRVALTCYERLPQQCHRTRVATALERMGPLTRRAQVL
jgi:uncharacterized protein (DUF488 family)